MDRGAWQATVHVVTKRQTRLKELSSSSSRIGWTGWVELEPKDLVQGGITGRPGSQGDPEGLGYLKCPTC